MIAELALAAALHSTPTTRCGGSTITTHRANNSYYTGYSTGGTCIQMNGTQIRVSASSGGAAWKYPNTSSGWEWNNYFHGTGTRFAFPVQESHDGSPRATAGVSMHGDGDASFDIWFNKTSDVHDHGGQNDGAEIMIWLKHPGVGSRPVSERVTIEGIQFDVWHTTMRGHGTSWPYVAYIAVHQRSGVKSLWLNPFFANARSHAFGLQPGYWLTSINFGTEITRGGAGTVASMQLAGLPAVK